MLVLEALDHVGGAAVSAQVFPGVDARLSRYSYLVSPAPPQPSSTSSVCGSRCGAGGSRPTRPCLGIPTASACWSTTATTSAPPPRSAPSPATTGRTPPGATSTPRPTTSRRSCGPPSPTRCRSADDVRSLVGADAWRELVEQPVGRTVAERVRRRHRRRRGAHRRAHRHLRRRRRPGPGPEPLLPVPRDRRRDGRLGRPRRRDGFCQRCSRRGRGRVRRHAPHLRPGHGHRPRLGVDARRGHLDRRRRHRAPRRRRPRAGRVRTRHAGPAARPGRRAATSRAPSSR